MTRRRLVVVLAALSLAACRGPDPMVDGARVLPSTRPDDEWFRVEARLSNQGRGSGQVGLTATLSDRRDGRILARAERDVTLEGRDVMIVVISLPRSVEARTVPDDRLAVDIRAAYPIE